MTPEKGRFAKMNINESEKSSATNAVELCERYFSSGVETLVSQGKSRQDAEMMIARYFGFIWPGELRERFSAEISEALKRLSFDLESQGHATREKDPGMEILIHRWKDKFRWNASLASNERRTFKEEAREVGLTANEKDGIRRMREVFYSVPDKSMRVMLESAWDGIGEWRS
jgi:hypothetical protein